MTQVEHPIVVPNTMVDCLDTEDPAESLRLIAKAAKEDAAQRSFNLQARSFETPLPLLLTTTQQDDHPLNTITACADSIRHTLQKIASGGSQASHEIRQLEQEKSDLEAHAHAVETALRLRKESDQAFQCLQSQQYAAAAKALRFWLHWTPEEPCRGYVGEYSLHQLENTYKQLQSLLLEQYQEAVKASDLKALGELTPVLGIIRLQPQAVDLYLQFLRTRLAEALQQVTPEDPPYVPMAKMYNAAVAALRHHLPMVSHALWKADGDLAVVRLVHEQLQTAVLPLIRSYVASKQLTSVAHHANRIAGLLEEQSEEANTEFQRHLGHLPDVDASLEEAALVLQHAETYTRFVTHTCAEVNRARELRFVQQLQQEKRDKERREWEAGQTPHDEGDDPEYQATEILPVMTPLHEAVAELGGQYASIERCLLLASLQRAFAADNDDPRYYRPLSIAGSSSDRQTKALQTALVESCWFAARRGTQRAFATGHTGTASAVTNFFVDIMGGVLLEVLGGRAEELGVASLKPGDGLLAGAAGLFNATNLIRQGTNVGTATQHKDELLRRRKVEEELAHACAVMNDLEVGVQYTKQLEQLLQGALKRGYPPNTHETEQLALCVKSMQSVTEAFQLAADGSITSLESVLKSRVRSIVADAVGGEGAGAGFMASSVMGGGKTQDKVTVRMNYDLDEDGYNLSQLGEGYIATLCSLLDELLDPLRTHLAPRLWDALLLQVVGTVAKRLDSSIRKSSVTALGALVFDSDVRDLFHYAKERQWTALSTPAMAAACPGLGRLWQVSKIWTVDEVDDILDVVAANKRKNQWDLRTEETRAYLLQRVEYDETQVRQVLPED